MTARDRYVRLVCVGDPFGKPINQRRQARYRFGMTTPYRQSNPQSPAAKQQRDDPGHRLASLQVVRGEARPRPLVLPLVEDILCIAAVPLLLGDRQ